MSKYGKLFTAMALMAAASVLPGGVHASVILVKTNDPGYYNNSLGTILNNTNGGNTSSGYFPSSNDASVNFPVAPNLSAANAILGNWLTDPLHLNAHWTYETSIPNSWQVGTEVAVIYQFNTLGATNVIARFGVDNGIFAWLDGHYLGGARRPGGVFLGEHTYNVGDLTAGTHFLQLLLEDHGVTNGYAVEITADTYVPGLPPTSSVPEPTSLATFSIAALLAGWRLMRGRGAPPSRC